MKNDQPETVRTIAVLITIGCLAMLPGGCTGGEPKPSPSPVTWEDTVSALRWVAYAPPLADPDKGIEASAQMIADDVAVLRRAGFTGLVSYSSTGTVGRHLPQLAQSAGFKGLILGVWDPANNDELASAEQAASTSIVLGYSVGNEGLGKRYDLPVLSSAIARLKTATGKRVTTTEEIDDYSDPSLLALGDWVFPNAHPYFHGQIAPDPAVTWTEAAFEDMTRRAKRFVLFKEVGLPTAGDAQDRLSEANQLKYYDTLIRKRVRFVYFEAFDQPWKTHLPIEPHWGIFRSDRTPKLLGAKLLKTPPVNPEDSDVFYIYQDAELERHFAPSGYMGDTGDIHIVDTDTTQPHSGRTSIRVTYTTNGNGPNTCGYAPPCKWAGVYWQEPPNNWGNDSFWAREGYDLSRFRKLRFAARAEKACSVEFKVGGLIGPYGDDLKYPRSVLAKLTTDWQEYEIDLNGASLTHIIGGFAWVTNWDANPKGATFYLDDIRFTR